MELTQRKKQILKIVVDSYINTAEPVGSKAIVDVYKRQVVGVIHLHHGAIGFVDVVDDAGQRGHQVQVELPLQTLLDDLHVAVSYTHLDVYKRQVPEWRSPRPAAPSHPSAS